MFAIKIQDMYAMNLLCNCNQYTLMSELYLILRMSLYMHHKFILRSWIVISIIEIEIILTQIEEKHQHPSHLFTSKYQLLRHILCKF